MASQAVATSPNTLSVVPKHVAKDHTYGYGVVLLPRETTGTTGLDARWLSSTCLCGRQTWHGLHRQAQRSFRRSICLFHGLGVCHSTYTDYYQQITTYLEQKPGSQPRDKHSRSMSRGRLYRATADMWRVSVCHPISLLCGKPQKRRPTAASKVFAVQQFVSTE